jgi:hypothetical protein
MTLPTGEFIRRFLTHVLPKGWHRICHHPKKTPGFGSRKIELPISLPRDAGLPSSPAEGGCLAWRRHSGGRRRDLYARRRATTRAGRRGGPDAVVERLKAKRRRTSTRADLGETSLDALLGRGVIDQAGYDAGVWLAVLLQLRRRASWLTLASVETLWKRLLVGSGGTATAPVARDGDVDRATIGDYAKRRLGAALCRARRRSSAMTRLSSATRARSSSGSSSRLIQAAVVGAVSLYRQQRAVRPP